MRVFLFLLMTALSMASRLAGAADDADSSYRLGNGYPVSDTGFRIGGYATAQVGARHAAPKHFEISDLSLFLTWDNGSRLRFFSELEVGDALSASEQQSLGI
ncbi:MAG: hypothetical protein QX203_01295, partial [Methylococcaceae bacterium]